MSARVSFRPTIAGDLEQLAERPPPHRIQAITALLPADPSSSGVRDGSANEQQVVGVGGLGFRPDGTVIAFAHLSDALRRYPAAVHRAGKLGMALIRRSGVALVIAQAQPGNPAAERWLRHFGFARVTVGDATAFVWRRENAHDAD